MNQKAANNYSFSLNVQTKNAIYVNSTDVSNTQRLTINNLSAWLNYGQNNNVANIIISGESDDVEVVDVTVQDIR